MFLYLKTGGGHLAPAKAVAEQIESNHKKNVKILLVDGLTESPGYLKRVIENGYNNIINNKNTVWIFELLYALHKIDFFSRLTASIISLLIAPGIEKQIIETKPKKIVIFHFFLIKPVYSIIRNHNLDISVLTVVTDPFTAPPLWFLEKGQNYILFSELLKDFCINRGINPENIHVFPFALGLKFSKQINDSRKLKIRRDLGFQSDSKIVLIIGGGEGMPRGKKILKKLITGNLDAEIAIVCGNNKKLFKQANKIKEKYGISGLKIFGFVDFVHSLISIADLVITKCGASTFMEILVMGKVPVINNYIWEQEKGNMRFICDREMGILEKSPVLLPDVLNRLLKDHDYYDHIINNIKKAGIRNGVGEVSDYILNFY